LLEKIILFNTRPLLKEAADNHIYEASLHGVFGGRMLVVNSTGNMESSFDKYQGSPCVSRSLSVKDDWPGILQCAYNEDLKIIISTINEEEILFVNEAIFTRIPPSTVPCQLLAFLYQRYKVFKGDKERGFVIVSTELSNGDIEKLETIILELAHVNELNYEFIDWVDTANFFCNSLVEKL